MLDNFNDPATPPKKIITDGPLPPGFNTWDKLLKSNLRKFESGDYNYIYTYSYILERRIKEIEDAAREIDAKYPKHNEVFDLLMLINHGIVRP